MEIKTHMTEQEIYQDEDFCAYCTPIRRLESLPPFTLVTLPRTTARHGYILRVCPNCDGGAAELGMRQNEQE